MYVLTAYSCTVTAVGTPVNVMCMYVCTFYMYLYCTGYRCTCTRVLYMYESYMTYGIHNTYMYKKHYLYVYRYVCTNTFYMYHMCGCGRE